MDQSTPPQQNPSPQNGTGTGSGMKPNVAATLSYVLGFVTGIIFFFISKDSFVRFHAMQSIITFVILTLLQWVLSFSTFFVLTVNIITLVLWIVLMIRAYKMEKYKLPVIGDLAEKWSK